MASSIRQTVLHELEAPFTALRAAEEAFKLAAIWQGPVRLQLSNIKSTFQIAARQGLDSLSAFYSVKVKYAACEEWKRTDPELEGGSLSGLRESYIRAVNAKIHEINKIYRTAIAALRSE